jgi:hypothetical protein
MMDFSPLAVERRQSLGRVVKEPSTVEMTESGDKLTTSLPYVEVVSDRSFRIGELRGMWIDRDKIILRTVNLSRFISQAGSMYSFYPVSARGH